MPDSRMLDNGHELPRRLTLVIGSLGPGGAERVLTTLANEWARRGYEVTLLTFVSSDKDHYQLDARVQRIQVPQHWASTSSLSRITDAVKRLRILRRHIRDSAPDVVVSFIETTNVRVLASLLGTRVQVIVSERVDPRQYDPGFAWRLLRRILYPVAAAVVVQTSSTVEWAMRTVNPKKVRVIPNPVLPTRTADRPATNLSSHKLMAMGRLVPQKGFDLLLEAWADLGPDRENWSLLIVGEGPERENLAAKASAAGVEDSVTFTGLVSEPESWFQQADLFILSSRFEGFPNVLLEAMACGLPVISFDCNSGPRDIIRDGVDGVLVPPEDVRALTATLRRLIRDSKERQRLAGQAKEVRNRFSVERIISQWDDLIETVVRGRNA